jgi:hypothetical protein
LTYRVPVLAVRLAARAPRIAKLPGVVVGLGVVEDEPHGPWRSKLSLGILNAVRFCGGHSLLSVLLVIATVAAVLTLRSAQASGARDDQAPCTWGASSVSAEMVDGKFVVSPVATSGCIPKETHARPSSRRNRH